MALANITRTRVARRQLPNLPGFFFWYGGNGAAGITRAYQDLVETGSGSSGASTITASATVANLVFPGMLIRIGGTDVYTVSTVVTTTITITGTLSTNYGAGSALAVERVSQWDDNSGRGNHATQGTALKQPLYIPDALKGRPALGFDGASTLVMPSPTYSISSAPNEVFAVAKRHTEAGTVTRILAFNNGGGASGDFRMLLGYSGTSGTTQYACNGTGSNVAKSGGTNTNYQLIQGGLGTYFQFNTYNNLSLSVATTGAVATTDRAHIGSNADTDRYLIGGIAEILGFNRSLANQDRYLILRYLAERWGIGI